MAEKQKRYPLHNLVYKIGRKVAIPFILSKYDYKTEIAPKIDGPYIVMCNHTTEVDMFMAVAAFPKHMYFVCGEHLLRSKWGDMLKKYVDPIPAPRGGNMFPAIKELHRRIKMGHNVMIFPEGCRSFNGETIPVEQATGKMVKSAKCALVTFKTHGGYFIAPRWSYHFRKGPASGEIVNVYTKEQIGQMSVEEITEAINRDLHENAYELQRKDPKPYVAEEGLAEGMENYLFICPNCGAYDSLETKGDDFHCKCCELKGTHDKFGFLKGENLRFDTVYDWGKWVENEFDLDADKEPDKSFVEDDVVLYQIDSANHERKDLFSGQLKVFKDRFEIGGHVFDYAGISASSLLYYGKSILFTHKSGYFGITGEHFHAWKSNRMYERAKGI